MNNIFKIRELRVVSIWLVFFIDFSIVSFSILASHLSLESLDLAINFSEYLYQKIFLTIAVNILFMLVFKTFEDIVRFSVAYKHLPLIENNSHEYVFVNVSGIRNLANIKKIYHQPFCNG